MAKCPAECMVGHDDIYRFGRCSVCHYAAWWRLDRQLVWRLSWWKLRLKSWWVGVRERRQIRRDIRWAKRTGFRGSHEAGSGCSVGLGTDVALMAAAHEESASRCPCGAAPIVAAMLPNASSWLVYCALHCGRQTKRYAARWSAVRAWNRQQFLTLPDGTLP